MKLVATGAFLAMTAIFILTEPLGRGTIFWVIRWDHLNAFAEAAMVGALADWFAVVALFRHPLGIPIWHTAIIPNKKDDIGRNLGNFVETRLLSVENLSQEISRFSVSEMLQGYLAEEEHRKRAAGWIADGLGAVIHAFDDDEVERMLGEMITARLRNLNASALLGRGLDMIIESGKHQDLVDQVLHQVAVWVPSRRDTIEEFIERSVQKTLKWGSKLVPHRTIDRATDQTLTALIEILNQAAADPNHPMRADLNGRVEEWADKLREDPDWVERVNEWKNDLVDNDDIRSSIGGMWGSVKEWLVEDLAKAEESVVRGYALRAVDSLRTRLEEDPELCTTIDERTRMAVISIITNNQGAIGSLIKRVVDSWDGERLSQELELNLGRDLQYIRLNGTFIGGLVGLVIHLLR
jgi:uncharacterized membrane-anchored protein YjiN (DUF445 family)